MSDTRSFDFDIDYALVANDDPVTVDGSKQTFADYPEEKPSKLAIVHWTDAWLYDLTTAGYGALLRGETPYALAKLAARPARLPRDLPRD